MKKHFNNLFVFGRPASGKSEFITFMKECDDAKRLSQMCIAPFDMIDDYTFIVELSENEAIFESFGVERKITKDVQEGIVVTDPTYFDYASEKINRILKRNKEMQPDFFNEKSRLIEFSRGQDKISYQRALSLIDKETLANGSIIYIKASYEESIRRNDARYQEKLKHSFLAHKAPDEAMERYYQNDDWASLTKDESHGFITINDVRIPFVTMDNEQESKDPTVLEGRYQTALQKLSEIWNSK
ncbi:MAG: hypothetical protein ABII18_06590 [bacterium]